MQDVPRRVFVGYEPTEDAAYKVCEASMRATASVPLHIEPLVQTNLRAAGLYRRQFWKDGEQHYDTVDGKPFSTEFSFTRFLVPALAQWRGWALFCDSDFLWRHDVKDLFDLADDKYAMMCVQHKHNPVEDHKMRQGQVQTKYIRKNWSSLMLWNCAHGANRMLTPYMVNTQRGGWLHSMDWLPNNLIGPIPETWNWLEGYSPKDISPFVIHYTTGTPDVPGHEDAAQAAEWWGYATQAQEAAE